MFKWYITNSLFWTLIFSSLLTPSFGQSTKYYLCGPNEDGCDENDAQYCACIPYNHRQATKPYCLDFNNMTCKPLISTPDCAEDLIYPTQGSCLATIFQSEPTPPCRIVSASFCASHQTPICNADGNPDSCYQQV